MAIEFDFHIHQIRSSERSRILKIIFSCFVLVLALTAANSSTLAQKETATGVDVEKDLALLLPPVPSKDIAGQCQCMLCVAYSARCYPLPATAIPKRPDRFSSSHISSDH